MRTAQVAQVAAIALLIALLVGVASGPAAAKRLVVLGFDGLDHALIQEMMDDGRLPNLSRMAKTGGFTSLATSIPLKKHFTVHYCCINNTNLAVLQVGFI